MTRYVNHCNCIHIAVHMGTWISSNFLSWAKKLLRSQTSKLIVTKWKHTLHMHQRFFKTWCHWKNVIATTLSKASLTVDLHYYLHSTLLCILRISLASWFALLYWWWGCLSVMESFTFTHMHFYLFLLFLFKDNFLKNYNLWKYKNILKVTKFFYNLVWNTSL